MPSAFFADQYCLTQSQIFWKDEANDLVSFEMFVRRLPPGRGYLICAGLDTALWWLEHIEFGNREWEWMVDHGFAPEFATWLYEKARPRFFTGDIEAIPEGTPIGANMPILRVTAPRIEATMIESMLLSAINHQIMVASKASRIVQAAQGRPVWDFSLRRLHGPDAGIGVARAAYIAGCAGTATIEAGRLLGIPTTGTMAHHFVLAYGPEREQECFERFMKEFPTSHALLVDTFNTLHGVRKAITASLTTSIPLNAVRLDSGNLADLSGKTRDLLDQNDMPNAKVLASSDLDEDAILALRDAPINAYGVGTRLGTVPDAPNLGGVYKLVEQHERSPRYVRKLSDEKSNDPGCHQVWRLPDGYYFISMADENVSDGIPLMCPAMRKGRRIPPGTIDDMRGYCLREVDRLRPTAKSFQHANPIRPGSTDLVNTIRESANQKEIDGHSTHRG